MFTCDCTGTVLIGAANCKVTVLCVLCPPCTVLCHWSFSVVDVLCYVLRVISRMLLHCAASSVLLLYYLTVLCLQCCYFITLLCCVFSVVTVLCYVFSVVTVLCYVFSVVTVLHCVFSVVTVLCCVFSVVTVLCYVFSVVTVLGYIFSVVTVLCCVFSVFTVLCYVFSVVTVCAGEVRSAWRTTSNRCGLETCPSLELRMPWHSGWDPAVHPPSSCHQHYWGKPDELATGIVVACVLLPCCLSMYCVTSKQNKNKKMMVWSPQPCETLVSGRNLVRAVEWTMLLSEQLKS